MVHGSTRVMACPDGTDPYEVPKKRGMFEEIASPTQLTTADIVQRIIRNK